MRILKIGGKRIKNNVLAIIACILWATAFAGIKIALTYSTPFFIAGTRFMLAGLILIPFAANKTRFFQELRSNFSYVLFIGILNTFILYGLFFQGLVRVSGTMGAIIIGSSPLITAVITHFMIHDDKLNWRKFFILSIGFVGIVIISITQQPGAGGHASKISGMVILFTGSIISAFSNIIIKKSKNNISPLALNSGQIFIGGVLLFILSFFLEGKPDFYLPFKFYIALLWLSSISAAGFSIWFYLIRQPEVKISELNVWKFIIPVLGGVLSWILLPDEFPTYSSLAGMLLVGFSIIYFNIRVAKKN